MKKNVKSAKLPLRTETVRLLSQQEMTQVVGGTLQTQTNPLGRCTISCEASKTM